MRPDGLFTTKMCLEYWELKPKESVTVTEIVYVPAEEKAYEKSCDVDTFAPLIDHT